MFMKVPKFVNFQVFRHWLFISGMFAVTSCTMILGINFEILMSLFARKPQLKWKSALRPCGCHVLSQRMRRISCLFLCLFPSQSLIPQTSGSAVVCPFVLYRKTRHILGNAAKLLTKTFPPIVPSFTNVNGQAAAVDAVN